PVRGPGTAHSFVTEFEGSGQINPNPVNAEDSDLLFDIYLSPEKLRTLSGYEDLQQVTSLEMCVDTRQTILGNLGVHLPNLVQLKMNNSLILSVRDLGITLSHLQVLSLVRCGLTDLEGLPSLSLLKELYVAYNNVSDLSQVCMLEQLELVDLEGNNVDDLVQVQYLGLCGKLKTLTLEGNPVCTCPRPGALQVSEYSYRSAVRKLIPQLQVLDDVPAEEEAPNCSSAMMEWALLKESIKDTPSFADGANDCLELMGVCDLPRPSSAQRPGSSMGYNSPFSRPSTARPSSSSVSSRPSSADSDADIPDHEASDLTHGVGRILFCGNPLQAIRARRQKIKLQDPSSHSRPFTQLGSYVPEHTYDVVETSSQDRSDVFAELRAWRKEHNKCLVAIERDHQPQVMRIIHSDADNDDDIDGDDDNNENKDSSNEYDDGTHSLGLISDKEDEVETQEGQKTSHRDTQSPDSLFQSPSPGIFILVSGIVFVEMSRFSPVLDHTMAPSPPPRAAAPSTGKRIAQIRARRLKVNKMGVGMQELTRETITSDVTGSRDMNHKVLCSGDLKMQPAPPQILNQTYRPGSSSMNTLQWEYCEHKPIIRSVMHERPTHTRPHTARAAMQR
ncbi:leucine-rich repeat-containing protein 56, partial [Silurus asotus]